MPRQIVLRLCLAAGLLAVGMTVAGVTGARAQNTAPPPPQEEVVPPPPGETYVWKRGHWHWDVYRNRYTWVAGEYVLRPRPRAVWVPGHWFHRAGAWFWHDGHWH
jgi:hypothetical protein